jgi:lipoprotein-releasing system ATP-binding protein
VKKGTRCKRAPTEKKSQALVKDRAIELLTMLGLKERAEHKPAELSGGE